jgi:hypothetical protein
MQPSCSNFSLPARYMMLFYFEKFLLKKSFLTVESTPVCCNKTINSELNTAGFGDRPLIGN